ncbi:hypothetical protein ID866_4815 [Astraeus odoratus]|nr:hypothetical protein ID866_4815 [Astraeus odoratus]
MTKYILISGGVVSGIGKGIIASSTGLLLKTAGLKVTAIKIDPYMNIDAGTMRPTEHGEVFVLNDGGEVDLDLGNYERYLDVTLSRDNNVTTGKIYREVIEKERRGEYLGKTIVPHVTNAIQDWIERVSKIPVDDSGEEPDVCIIELGGTVGDIESAPFIEAMRQFQFRVGYENFALIHVSLVPDMHGEQKTKPTQTTVHALRGLGLLPDLVRPALRHAHDRYFDEVKIVIVGKYTEFKDSYMSVIKALEHSAFRVHRRLVIQWVESSNLEAPTLGSDPAKYHDAWRAVVGASGILVPGGFGQRGTEGMILAIKWSREQKVPFLGICLGFQMAVLEWARNVLDVQDAQSTEFVPDTPSPFIIFMPEISRTHMGGTMRLGLRPTIFQGTTTASALVNGTSNSCTGVKPSTTDTPVESPAKWSKARQLYGNVDRMWERHRHRYEVNPEQVARLEASGLTFVGKDEKGERMQILELKGLQPHPELCSRPLNPSPPFLGFIAAACGSSVLAEQLEEQSQNYRPPHPESSMVSEETLRLRTMEHPVRGGSMSGWGTPIAD